MKIHFLNVGHGDCTIIEHENGHISMVDINNGSEIDEQSLNSIAESFGKRSLVFETYKVAGSATSYLAEAGYDIKLTNPIEFLAQNYAGKNIWRYIQTHPHMDHMRGLYALKNSPHKIVNFWDTKHTFTPDTNDSNKQDWDAYTSLRGDESIATVLKLKEGETGFSYNRDSSENPPGDGIEILHPPVGANTAAEKDKENPNNFSYVLRVTHNGYSTILGGDAEEPVWEYLVKTYGKDLKCNVLKASHHGRDSGYHAEAVKLMNPDFTIVSVGKKPDQDASNKYRGHSTHVWSTRWRGNITVDTITGEVTSEYKRK